MKTISSKLNKNAKDNIIWREYRLSTFRYIGDIS